MSRGWRREVNIKQFLEGDPSPENAVDAANKIANYLRSHLWDYPTVFPIVFEFEKVKKEPKKWRVIALNNTLDHLYDWADDQRVWLGL